MVSQNFIEPIALIAVGLAVVVYAIATGIALLFACACLVVALGCFEYRQTATSAIDAEKLRGRDSDEAD